jgi:hypothetical protein
MFAMDTASPHFARVHDGAGDSGLAMHRPGFCFTDAPLSDELQRAHDGNFLGVESTGGFDIVDGHRILA